MLVGYVVLILSMLIDISIQEVMKQDLRMPDVTPKLDDTYLCVGVKLNTSAASYIVGFEPHSVKNAAHHMIVEGCERPGYLEGVWDCGEMHENKESSYKRMAPCRTGSSILYAWAMDAPSLSLPSDVAFEVGGSSNINYLVLQVHYKKGLADKRKDNSGITLLTSQTPKPKKAAVHLSYTLGTIPAQSIVYMESACLIEENTVLHPFAFRGHTHKLGRVVSGYRVRNGVWSEIGRINPRLPQMFYNVTNPGIDLRPGDIIAARCTMENDGPRDVDIGATQDDEMCNFYMMFWVQGGPLPNDRRCSSMGYPEYSWATSYLADELNLDAVPEDVSTRPDTLETYPAFNAEDLTLRDILDGMGNQVHYYDSDDYY